MPGTAALPSPEASISEDDNNRLTTWLRSLLRPIADHVLLPCWACKPALLPFLGRFHDAASTVTGTIICPHNDKVKLCLQADPSAPPLLLLDLPVTTSDFAAVIHCGGCRIALECEADPAAAAEGRPLLNGADAWAVYLNGRKAGFASRRRVTEKDTWLLETMRTVWAGAGILSAYEAAAAMASPSMSSELGAYKYLRGNFERVVGSRDSESYHLVDPEGCLGHEFSLFFLRKNTGN